MPLADCLRPFNQSDRHKVQPLINELRQAVGDDHLLGIQTELFEVLVKIVGNLPLSSSSGYFWPGSYIDFSLKLSSIALNLLRQVLHDAAGSERVRDTAFKTLGSNHLFLLQLTHYGNDVLCGCRERR